MDDAFWVKAKVLPNKEALDVFMKNWTADGAKAFNGEVDLPESQDPARLVQIRLDRISHSVEAVAAEQFDPATMTVPIKVRMTGPCAAEAREKYIRRDLRFVSRVVNGLDRNTHLPVSRIVTFDCIQRPDPRPIDKHKDNVRQKRDENAWAEKKRIERLKKM